MHSDRPQWRPVGAHLQRDGSCRFTVWAPRAQEVAVELLSSSGTEKSVRTIPLQKDESGYHSGSITEVFQGTRYLLRLDGKTSRPDPASRSQPDGVNGPSEVVSCTFPWSDIPWSGVALENLVLYELHVGTSSAEGTFEAVIPQLDRLAHLGITALEIMPIAQFPGARNWGYDGVFPFAAQNSYGGLHGFQTLVDACHRAGLAVILDVVYNHLGPEGNSFAEFGPYFSSVFRTPWGDAINFDDRDSDGVRNFFLESAKHWILECRVDGFRLDAIQAIFDRSPQPFLEDLTREARNWGTQRGWSVLVLAETDQNDPRLVRPHDEAGIGLDGFWSDDLHHGIHALTTGERVGYYRDYGTVTDIAVAWELGMNYQGHPSKFRGRRHGRPAQNLHPARIIGFSQNHDQVGNRGDGTRHSQLLGRELLKVSAAVVLLSPLTPLLFMGEEYGEEAPFFFFTDYLDPKLNRVVDRSRRRELAEFGWTVPPPPSFEEETYRRSQLSPEKHLATEWGRQLHGFYRALLDLRPQLDREDVQAQPFEDAQMIFARCGSNPEHRLAICFSEEPGPAPFELPTGRWSRVLESGETRWGGPGVVHPESFSSSSSANHLEFQGPGVVVYRKD